MKFFGFLSLILCIFLSQICSSRNIPNEKLNKAINDIRDGIYGVNEKFMDDVETIAEKYQNKTHDFVYGISEFMIKFGGIPKKLSIERNVKINPEMLKEYHSKRNDDPLVVAFKLDAIKILQSILSKDLPPERYQGIMNVLYVYINPNATFEEIESTLVMCGPGYLYGTDDTATKTSFLSKFPDMTADDCAGEMTAYSELDSTLKSFAGVKPKVIEDFMAIRDKYPCNFAVQQKLNRFVSFIKPSQDSKVDACLVKANKHYANWNNYEPHNTKKHMQDELVGLEFVLSARLTEETYGGIITFLKATMPDTPNNEIEKALEYVYDDVPKVTQCP